MKESRTKIAAIVSAALAALLLLSGCSCGSVCKSATSSGAVSIVAYCVSHPQNCF